MEGLEVRGLVKRYGDNAVVNDVSFSIDEGEFFVLLGPSGGGKSTLLRLICGLEQPDEGKIILSGRDITRLPARERNVGMVFQDYGLYPHMNVAQNIAYGLEARGGYTKTEIERLIQDVAKRLSLTELLERPVVDLSGGEQQRVAVARAMVKNADLYLFDEPLSNLDPRLRHQARRDILMLHREKRKPSLYVTHDQTEALVLGDRIGVIAKGRIMQIGRAEDLLERPANLFIAGFIGSPSMNLLPATLIHEDDRYRVHADGVALTLPSKWRPIIDAYHSERVILGIRPSAVSQAASNAEADNVLSGIIKEVEPLVGETVVTFKVGEAMELSVVFQGFDESLRPGEQLTVGVDVEQLCLFDPETEQALSAP